MEIVSSKKNGKLLLSVRGRIDTNTSGSLLEYIEQCLLQNPNIILDIKEIDYISSAGLRVFLSAHKRCRDNGGVLTIENASETAIELFEMTGFSDFLHLV